MSLFALRITFLSHNQEGENKKTIFEKGKYIQRYEVFSTKEETEMFYFNK